MLLSLVSMLDKNFYEKTAIELARELLGKMLIHEAYSGTAGGIIVETEAYCGIDDPASHAANGPTPRSKIMFGPSGISYVYFSYGMHNLFNIVSDKFGIAGAVLVRAIEPKIGIELMKKRRKTDSVLNLCSGPGKLTTALSITLKENGLNLRQKPLCVTEGNLVPKYEICSSPRIGISKATEHPWRFFIKGSPFVSARNKERSQYATAKNI